MNFYKWVYIAMSKRWEEKLGGIVEKITPKKNKPRAALVKKKLAIYALNAIWTIN
jgi:hypothetical protein